MANTRSDVMALRLGDPATLLSVRKSHGRVHMRRASAVSVAGDGVGHLYVLERFSAFDVLLFAYCNNTADAGWTDINVGVYAGDADGQTSAGDWTVADQTLITSCQDIIVDGANRAAASAGHDELFGTGTNGIAENLEGLPLWEMCATVSTKPKGGTQYDLVAQSVGDPAGGGTMVWTFFYTAGD